MKKILTILLGLFFTCQTFAAGEAATYFEIYVPPNNDWNGRDVCLIVTAIYNNTTFNIVDDDMDGDNDDSVSGTLMAGQSYILYIRDNGINDDAPHSGEGASKQDGDYFIITSSNLVLVSQSTNSDWQHDWVPATNKSSIGERFIIYSPKTSYSNRDLNVFAYENSTQVNIRKISMSSTTSTGYTDVDLTAGTLVCQKELNIGEDLIFYYQDGRNIMETGATYLIESTKPVTVQYGALWQNARDGGGYVPSANGSSSGEEFYFTVPYQSSREQEIRIVSWDDANSVSLDKYVNGSWTSVDSWSLNNLDPGDWISYSGNVNAVFRVSCSSDKSVSVFEANWLETGSPGTSDVASMVSSKDGTTAGTTFLVYMAPPGTESNVTNPFTGSKFSQQSHIYLFARNGATVTVKDAYSNGGTISRSYTINAGRYVDCYLNLTEWRSIYNGNGNPNSGPQRPYLLVESDSPISVFNTNFNDNWMSYFGSSQTQDFSLSGATDKESSTPGDTITITSGLNLNLNQNLVDPEVKILVGDGSTPTESTFIDATAGTQTFGNISFIESTAQSEISFGTLSPFYPNNSYSTETKIVLDVNFHDGNPVPENTVISIETVVSGTINGVYQQSSSSNGVTNNSGDHTLLYFSKQTSAGDLLSSQENSWGVSLVDYNGDQWDDIFFPNYNTNDKNELYKNNGDGTFIRIYQGPGNESTYSSVVSSWADYNNDGNIDVISGNNKGVSSYLFKGTGNGSFSKITDGSLPTSQGYTHGATWADYNNDGFIDLFLSDYMPTRFNKLYKNNGDNSFSKVSGGDVSKGATYSIGASWADYDNDGDADLYVPNDKDNNNFLYQNNGDGSFTAILTGPLVTFNANSTGCSWGDYDNDMDLDLFVTSASNSNNLLFQNNGGGSFTQIATGDIVTDGGDSHGSAWGDIDNDGFIDLFVANDREGAGFLYLNNGDGSFTKVTNDPTTTANGNSMAAAFSDMDRDGDLDLLIANHSNESNFYFTNNGNSNNWLQVRLTGTNSNKSAIGARVKVKATILGSAVWQMREISSQTGGGAGAQSSLVAHFGLGNATSVDSIIVIWPSGYIQNQTNVSSNQLLSITEDNGALVSGKVYNDLNGDCIYTIDEPLLSNIVLRITPGNRYIRTNNVGEFTSYLEPGSYTLEQDPSAVWSHSCPSGGNYSIVVSNINESFLNKDFGNQALSSLPDLWVDVGSTALRRGFQNTLSIDYRNSGAVSTNGVLLSLEMPNEVFLISSEPSWDTYANNTYEWNLGSLGIDEDGGITIVDSVDLYANLGATSTFTASITSASPDFKTSDNNATVEETIVGSLDPNDILVYPKSDILLTDTLHYKIRFQNVGNYFATNIIVIDTLPDWADVRTVVPGACSHPGLFEITRENILQWKFLGIELPDSVRNEPESHGFVKFSVQAKMKTQEGIPLTNRAAIQFDFNPYLITNQVTNIILSRFNFLNGELGELLIYPNPCTDKLNLRVKVIDQSVSGIQIRSIRIFDITGRIMHSLRDIYATHHEINLDFLPTGVYIIEVYDEFGQRHFEKLRKELK
jgi:hypothetical protein